VSATYNTFFLFRWAIFLVRRTAFIVYGLLNFITKPGSRFIVPVVLAISMFMAREPLGRFFVPLIGPPTEFISTVAYDTINGPPGYAELARRKAVRAYYGYDVSEWSLDIGLLLIFLVSIVAYNWLSFLLSVVLGAFPKVTRPLRPLRRLEPTARNIRSATVQIAVPKLRR
jgi:hypothetical protein